MSLLKSSRYPRVLSYPFSPSSAALPWLAADSGLCNIIINICWKPAVTAQLLPAIAFCSEGLYLFLRNILQFWSCTISVSQLFICLKNYRVQNSVWLCEPVRWDAEPALNLLLQGQLAQVHYTTLTARTQEMRHLLSPVSPENQASWPAQQ